MPQLQPSEISFRGIVHYADGQFVLASRRNMVFHSTDGGNQWEKICSIPLRFMHRVQSRTRIGRRLFRAKVGHVLPVAEDKLLILAFKKAFVYDLQNRQFLPRPATIHGSRPLAVCRVSESELFYGQYFSNPERQPAHVYASEDGGVSWRSIYAFQGVRHVHGVYSDPYTGSLWITTGDSNTESAVWVTDDRFHTIERVISGGQQARAVQLLFTKEYVYFGSDTPQETNYLWRYRRSDGTLERLQQVDSSVFFGCAVGESLFFSTACEPSEVNHATDAVVWGSADGTQWRPAVQFRKDTWPKRLFQHGHICFPAGPGTTDGLWLTPIATACDELSLRYRAAAPQLETGPTENARPDQRAA